MSDTTTYPTTTISSVTVSPPSGDLNVGQKVTLTLDFSGPVTVAGGTPTLSLNDGGTAAYAGGSGTSALTFGYTVRRKQNTAALAATGVNLNSATITDSNGDAADLTLTDLAQTGPQVDTTRPGPVEIPTEGEVIAVAKAMDVDERLDWDSPDHDKVVARSNAMDEAEHFIIGVRAVGALAAGQLEVVEPVDPNAPQLAEPLAPADPNIYRDGEATGDLDLGDTTTDPYVPPLANPAPQPVAATS